jgi:hypothetical protein
MVTQRLQVETTGFQGEPPWPQSEHTWPKGKLPWLHLFHFEAKEQEFSLVSHRIETAKIRREKNGK